jgi:hypothetical protein
MVERGLFRAKRINHCNDFVARVALEVVDSFWWKQQLRVKSAGSRTTALPSNEEASRQPLFDFASFCANLVSAAIASAILCTIPVWRKKLGFGPSTSTTSFLIACQRIRRTNTPIILAR